jgi:putative tricarboxylic transport membrane protein
MDQQSTVRKGQMAFQGLLLIGALVLLWEAYRIEGVASISGSGIFPMLAALALIISLAVRLVADYRTLKSQKGNGQFDAGSASEAVLPLPILGFVAVCAAYSIGMTYVGFWIATGLFLALTFAWLYTRNILKLVLITGGAVAFIYLVFAFVFKVYLP